MHSLPYMLTKKVIKKIKKEKTKPKVASKTYNRKVEITKQYE